ncbi:cryptochrome/photolyase family protein [Nocardioides acrostichi]|uniref:Cryptochrome/photolyase family protein n=1 Tax=Nocardioides acrostichi TaxID=2784339 RepID=A0A930UZX1_9ACTN|nr:cryptochrome/photolyase family protein [Nocardioides acrostichi]MBF4162115.1 cryptochrome/photolyase family protein [Nocardioides acrostichi]
MSRERHVRLVLPHQLFTEHLDKRRVDADTTFVLVEHDLLFRQYRFHTQKLVLHRASMRRFADRLREAGFDVETIETDGRTTSRSALAKVIDRLDPTRVTAYDVVDDWLSRDLTAALADGGYELTRDDVLDTPNFLTSRDELAGYFDGVAGPRGKRARMADFYAWQRRRLDVLVEGDQPVGGRWSFDEENRKKLPRGYEVPSPETPRRHEHVEEAIAWVERAFPDNPGNADAFAWPTSHAEAERGLTAFLEHRFIDFGPYEDAISVEHPFLFHSLLTPGLNIGLLDPRRVVDAALDAAEEHDVPLASLEGFVRQVIGWREYMRAAYVLWGRRLRSRNHLEHGRPLAEGWWTADSGLDPVDHVLGRVLEHGYAHHIERLMVLGNAMCLLRSDPDAVYEWFMEMFVDAYDWVMVPNVYAMSQFASGEAITTKPYVSGSNYLKKMSDLPRGEWEQAWDGLYWTFVRDHHDVFARNGRSQFVTRAYEKMDAATKAAHTRAASPWLAD